MSRKKAHKYTDKFCEETVCRSEMEGMTAVKVAQELGISAAKNIAVRLSTVSCRE